MKYGLEKLSKRRENSSYVKKGLFKKEIKNRAKGRKMEDDVEGTWKRVPATRDRIVGKPSIASEK